jgi:hypothetical protein
LIALVEAELFDLIALVSFSELEENGLDLVLHTVGI